jgi:sugar lactone lactonase YvrE
MCKVDVLVAAGAELAEGPLWLDETGEVAWVDILRGHVHWTALESGDDTFVEVGEPVSALAMTTGGELVGATPHGLRLIAPAAGHPLVAALPGDRNDLRMNDGKVDPRGRFVGGTVTMGEPQTHAGALWSFDGPGARRLLDGVTISNGLCWSADGSTLFYIDTPTQRVDAFDYDAATGDISNRRPVIEIDPAEGSPDGMCGDSDGGLWIALWGGGRVSRYVDGRIDEVIEVPTPYVTSVAFCGTELDRLVITSAAQPYGTSCPPGAGHVYRTVPGVSGRASARYQLVRSGERADPLRRPTS